MSKNRHRAVKHRKYTIPGFKQYTRVRRTPHPVHTRDATEIEFAKMNAVERLHHMIKFIVEKKRPPHPANLSRVEVMDRAIKLKQAEENASHSIALLSLPKKRVELHCKPGKEGWWFIRKEIKGNVVHVQKSVWYSTKEIALLRFQSGKVIYTESREIPRPEVT